MGYSRMKYFSRFSLRMQEERAELTPHANPGWQTASALCSDSRRICRDYARCVKFYYGALLMSYTLGHTSEDTT